MYRYLDKTRLEEKILSLNLTSLDFIQVTAKLLSDNYSLPVSLPIPGIAFAT
jgi:hypothetical protein